MSVGLLAVRLLYRFYVCVHLSKWFTFFSFKFVSVCCVVVFLRLLVTPKYTQLYNRHFKNTSPKYLKISNNTKYAIAKTIALFITPRCIYPA